MVLAAIGALALACVAGGSAQAAPPTIEHFDVVGVDEECSGDLTEFCGFTVTVFVEEHTDQPQLCGRQ